MLLYDQKGKKGAKSGRSFALFKLTLGFEFGLKLAWG